MNKLDYGIPTVCALPLITFQLLHLYTNTNVSIFRCIDVLTTFLPYLSIN